MRKLLNAKKTNYTIIIIKGLIIFLFAFATIRDYQEIIFELNINYEDDYTISDFFILITNRGYFRASYILLIPLIGCFINKKIGWIFMTSYFYFLVTNLTYSTIGKGIYNTKEILLFSTISILISLFILIMNGKNMVRKSYDIQKGEILISNIKASYIGIFITLFTTWFAHSLVNPWLVL
ncbi:hypothetical protein [uncultured Aquimarina sp.]|uniref:hypothetical protein n=1 Tax=uncultured Aquimarina sp. TaxID=575652 RepID=UPI00260AA31C|nr:hypothetical protein [uncultured Aquimarina sp.]